MGFYLAGVPIRPVKAQLGSMRCSQRAFDARHNRARASRPVVASSKTSPHQDVSGRTVDGIAGRVREVAGRALVGTAIAAALSLSSPSVVPIFTAAHALVPGNSPLPSPAVQEVVEVPVPEDGGATAVLDYGRVLSAEARAALEAKVDALERDTAEHWKLRIVTAYGAGSAPTINALEKYWGADSRTIIMSWDEFKGNVLEFYYPTSLTTVPRAVFQELRGRFGNVYFVDEEGTEESVNRVTRVLVDCLTDGGCTFVPGLSEQQRLFSLVPITSGAFLSGGALRQGLRNRWSVIFLLLWAPWIVGFGYYPLYIRQPDDITPLIENTLIFAAIFAFTISSPILGGNKREEGRSLLGSMGRSSAGTTTERGNGVSREKESKSEAEE